MRTISIVNQKGGCGKTTTAINLAAIYAARGLRTLLIDMDPQSHCAAGLGVPESRIEYSIGDALLANHKSNFDPSPLIWEVARNLYLAPSTVMLTALEAPGGPLHMLPDKDRRLESLLNLLGSRFDRCLIDCPPTIGLLTFNAMRAAREALIPVETGYFSLRGAERQWMTIQKIIAHIGRPIACHLLATLHNPDSQTARSILTTLRRQFAGQILPVVINEHEALREAASLGQPVLEYAPQSKAREDFEALASWLEEHHAKPSVEIEVMSSSNDPIRTCAPVASAGSRTPQLPESDVPAPMLGMSGAATAAPSSRAAELVRRVHDLAARTSMRMRELGDEIGNSAGAAQIAEPAVNASPPVHTEPRDLPQPWHSIAQSAMGGAITNQEREAISIAAEPPAPSALREVFAPDIQPSQSPPVEHLFGARLTSQGVLFVQPASGAKCLAVAGDFNLWSPTATPMTLNAHLGVFEVYLPLAPGRYEYRIVADDQWMPDPHNDHVNLNSYGEPNSVVVVGAPTTAAAGTAHVEHGFEKTETET